MALARTIAEIQHGLSEKTFSAVELTQSYLDTIEQKDSDVAAFLSVLKDTALEQAQAADKMLATGEAAPLCGVPIALKDNLLVAGEKCTAASKVLEEYVASYDATVVTKLKEQGAVIVGKTNLDEFAMGSSTEYSAFGETKNPHDASRVPGGSSGGSAAAVAADMAPVALGSDTGGSVRLPASFCGVVGMKPTYGTVSRSGLIAMASSLDQIGPFANTVTDAQLVFEAIAGKDSMDATSVDRKKTEFSKKLRIGVPKEYFGEGLDAAVEKNVRSVIETLEKDGAEVVEISLPHTEYVLPAYYIINASEISANLARYDGIRYGHSNRDGDNLLSVYLATRHDYLGQEVKRRIMLGTYALSSGYYDAYYVRAQKVRTKIAEDFTKAFARVDVLMTPTSPVTAFERGAKTADPVTMYLADVLTASVNLAGLPAISVPCGEAGGLPVGLQVIGPALSEDKLFGAAKLCEAVYAGGKSK